MRQIRQRDYAGRFAASDKTRHLVAASFSSKEKKIVEWTAELATPAAKSSARGKPGSAYFEYLSGKI